jgi:hypothetical protein
MLATATVSLADTQTAVGDTQTMVGDTQTMVADIHRVLGGQRAGVQHHLVSVPLSPLFYS